MSTRHQILAMCGHLAVANHGHMDQASALHSIRIEALGLDLLEVRHVEAQEKPRERRDFRSP